jgi:SM-20-related protein
MAQNMTITAHSAEMYHALAQTLSARGWEVWHNFISMQQVHALAAEAQRRRDEGAFHAAGIGRGAAFCVRPDIRGDSVHWLDPHESHPALSAYLTQLDTLRVALNRQLFLGLRDFEGHLAIYPPATFYARHCDQFEGTRQRQLTCVLYLNAEWADSDGGQLRLYIPHPDGSEHFHDIRPQGGTLVCFLSECFEHEVLPAQRERISLTGWFVNTPIL